MPAPQLINCQWFAAVTGSVIRVRPARGLEGPTVSSKHRNLSSCLSVPREREGWRGGKELGGGRGERKGGGEIEKQRKGICLHGNHSRHPPPPPTLFPTLCRELWWSLCNAIPLECTVWISAEQCPQGSDRATVKTLLPRSNAVITQHRGAFASMPDKAKAWQCSGD